MSERNTEDEEERERDTFYICQRMKTSIFCNDRWLHVFLFFNKTAATALITVIYCGPEVLIV